MIMMTNDDNYDVLVIIMILLFYLQNVKTRGGWGARKQDKVTFQLLATSVIS